MVYTDLLILQDIIYSYVILLGTSILLTRITNLTKIFLASVIGGIPLIFLFIDLKQTIIFLINIIFSIIMSIISFSYKDIIYTIKNVFYMYIIGIFLAGSIYLIHVNFLPFIDSYIFNVIILILISPPITTIYIKSITKIKTNYSNYYKVDIYLKENIKITMTAFLDTGNKLVDPYKQRPIMLINKLLINTENQKILLVPYRTLNNNNLLQCIVPKKIYIYNVGFRNNLLLGLMDEVNIEGVDGIISPKLLERI